MEKECILTPADADYKLRSLERRLETMTDGRKAEYLNMVASEGQLNTVLGRLEKRYGLTSLDDMKRQKEILDGFVSAKQQIDKEIDMKKAEAEKMVEVYRQEKDHGKSSEKPEDAASRIASLIISKACYVDEDKRKRGEEGKRYIMHKIAGNAISGIVGSSDKIPKEDKQKEKNLELF